MWLFYRKLYLAGPSHNKRAWYSSVHWSPTANHYYLKHNKYGTSSKATADSEEHPADLSRLWVSPRRTVHSCCLESLPTFCSAWVHLAEPQLTWVWNEYCPFWQRYRQGKQETVHRGSKSLFLIFFFFTWLLVFSVAIPMAFNTSEIKNVLQRNSRCAWVGKL